MKTCQKCGSDGAKTLLHGGRNMGCLCRRCAERISGESLSECDSGDPRYSDHMEVRELYHNLMSAPNNPWRGW